MLAAPLERDAICWNRLWRPHPALALCFDEHIHPPVDRAMAEHALIDQVNLLTRAFHQGDFRRLQFASGARGGGTG